MQCKNNSYNNWFNLVPLLFVFVIGCGPNKGYNVKSFFFDGVPNPFEIVAEVKIDSLALLTHQDSLDNLVSLIKKPEFHVHTPYLERKCNDCHNPNSMGKLKTPLKELCFNCHDNFNNTYTAVHGPVASGNCTQCHDPHKSKIKGLLLEEGNDLCFKCHDESTIIGSKIHETIEDKSCVTCHNPHGGENKYILQTNACYECHTNFEEKYAYLHGPVGAGGLCTTCHEGHSSTKPSNLKLVGNDLCLNCHNKLDVDKNQAHTNIKKQSCTNCHNPHGSSQLMLLTKTVVK